MSLPKIKTRFKIFNDDMIDDFVKYLHTYLKKYNACFLNGAYVIEDNDRILYNFLTYNTISNKCLIDTIEMSKNVSIHWTTTHSFFVLPDVLKVDCVPYGKIPYKYFKLERILNKPLKYLCDLDTYASPQQKDKKTKRVALFYPFKFNDKTYLFLKFENNKMNSIKHAFNYLSSNITQKKSSYNTRKDTNEYTINSLEDDLTFYTKMKNVDSLKEYNIKLRFGNEFFISNKVFNKIMKSFLYS